ncbi:MAG: tetratricopeptide repeat protein [Bacteroidia bacterium]|nr:tetratricopeptide repeat protein [Bacteroidia bacterium]
MNQKQALWISMLICIAWGIVIYIPSIAYSYQFDDIIHIADNQHISSIDPYKDVSFWATHWHRPFSKFTFTLTSFLNDNQPQGHRWINIILHFINGVLVYFLFLKIITKTIGFDDKQADKNKITALFIAGIFLVHPIQIQSVVYIIQRMNLLSAFFTFSALLLYIKGRDSYGEKKSILLTGLCYLFALIAMLLGIMSKQNAAVILLLIIMLEFTLYSANRKREWIFRILFLIITAIGILGFVIFTDIGLMKTTLSPLRYFVSQWTVMLQYIRMVFIPYGLNIDHVAPGYQGMLSIRDIFALGIHLAAIGWAVFKKNGHPAIRIGILWFYAAHSVESGLIPISDIMVEHRNYLPLTGLFFIIGTLLFQPIKKPYNLLLFTVLIVSSYGAASVVRINDWKSMETIWQDSVTKNKKNKRAWNNLSYALLTSDPDRAIKAGEKALMLDSAYYEAYDNIGAAYYNLGDTAHAIYCFNKSVRSGSGSNPVALFNLANLYLHKDPETACELFEKVITMNPEKTEAYAQLGYLYHQKGDYLRAIKNYTHAYHQKPNKLNYLINIAVLEDLLGNADKSITLLEEAAKSNFDNEMIFYTLANLYGEHNRFSQSLEAINQAIRIHPTAKNFIKRGYIYEQSGAFHEAIADYQRVLSTYPSKTLEKKIDNLKTSINHTSFSP